MHKTLTVLNFLTVGYFLLMYLVYIFKIDAFIIGFFRELLTIPAMFGQLVLIILGVLSFIKKDRDRVFTISLALLIICAVLTIGSFFF